VATLAAHWGCGTDTVYALIRSGDLQAFRLGGKLLRIRGDQVERYEWQKATVSNDTGESSPSSGSREEDATDIRLERLIERPQRPQLVHSGNVDR
jgi:excisionase family DNA binding protein